jgi:hypothetical protein
MNIKIIEVVTKGEIKARIREGNYRELPSLHDGWRFNFGKQLSKLANATAYVLVTEEEPDVVQGCMIFQMVEKRIPTMTYLEIAPHNRYDERKYDRVAGCLIAYAFKRSLIDGMGDYNGQLFLDVLEEDPENEHRLIKLYTNKYNAKVYGGTRLYIIDDDGQELIDKYLQAE